MSPQPGVPPVSVLQVLLPDEPLNVLQDMTAAEWFAKKTEFSDAYQARVANLIAAAGRRKKREISRTTKRTKRQVSPTAQNYKKILLPQNKIYGNKIYVISCE